MLRAAQADDQEAWRRLVHLYSRRMYRWCRMAGLQPADASNAVQEAFAAVARNLPSFRHCRPTDTFRGWLCRIVENKIRDHYRRASRAIDRPQGGSEALVRLAGVAEPEVLDSPTHHEVVDWSPSSESEPGEPTWNTNRPIPEELVPERTAPDSALGIQGTHGPPSEVHAAISQVRNQVSERDWRFFWRVVVDGQSASEVAQEFEVTANTVRLVKMRVLRRLRQALEPKLPQDS